MAKPPKPKRGRRHTNSPVRFFDFRGGLNLDAGDRALSFTEMAVLENLTLERTGALRKRAGVFRANPVEVQGYKDSL